MPIGEDFVNENEEILAFHQQSTEQNAGHTASDNIEATSITIEWLKQRIAELEAVNAALRSAQPQEQGD